MYFDGKNVDTPTCDNVIFICTCECLGKRTCDVSVCSCDVFRYLEISIVKCRNVTDGWAKTLRPFVQN